MFSGIGAQHKALKNLKSKGICDFEIVATSEWDINAIISYDSIHNGPIKNDKLEREFQLLWKKRKEKSLDEYLQKYTFSKDGKSPIKDIKKIDIHTKKRLFIANIRSKNLGDVKSLKNKILPKTDVLTYSFPCQDLSIANMGRQKGMGKNDGTRSGLLWEVEKILKIYRKNKSLPNFLILENVGNMLSKKFEKQYEEWVSALEKIGYYTETFKKGLDARSFGIPQKRKRIFAISYKKEMQTKNDFTKEFLKKIKQPKKYTKEYLFKNYLIGSRFKEESRDCMVKLTKSRIKMINQNPVWNINATRFEVPTITTKQDRHPNCGFVKEKEGFRFLTPRETMLLMGFNNKDFERIKADGQCPKKNFLYKQAGNSIVVNILEEIFSIIYERQGQYDK